MTNIPSPSPPSDAAAASTAICPPSAAAPDNNLGPVTKLAAIAAARAEEARLQKRRLDETQLKATATLVGETAFAIAAATASGSPVRLSPARRQIAGRQRTVPEMTRTRTSPNSRRESPNGPKMSVAARARAAADFPSAGRGGPPGMPAARGGARAGNTAPAPASGGVMRGKFSRAQVQKLCDEWGKDGDSDDDGDFYYDGTSDSSGADDNEEHDDQYKQSLQQTYHHLQYTMSNSPGPLGDVMEDAVSAKCAPNMPMAEENDGFHYQHHRVSAYSTAAENNMYGQGGSHGPSASAVSPRTGNSYRNQQNEEGEDSGGLFESAKNWLQSQRDRLHQIELERQVQAQRRKLVEEGRRQRALEADRRRRNASSVPANCPPKVTTSNNEADAALARPGVQTCEIAQSGSFGCPLDGSSQCVVGTTEESSDTPEQTVAVTGIPASLCGFGGAYANELDDSTDYSGVPRVDSEGNVLGLIPSGSLDSLEGGVKDCMTVSSPKSTLSGKGMSVQVDIPDDNEYQEINSGNAAMNGVNNFEEGDDDDPTILFETDVKIVPEPAQDDVSTTPQILQQSQMKALIASGGLPPSVNFCKWKRLYSLTRDGDSFEQFLRLVGGHDRTVLVVKTTLGQLFGGYADTRWESKHFRQHAHEFYGSAQACLFRFPNFGTGSHEDKISIYKWTGANRYIQLCNFAKRTVAFGGGGFGGGFGLCIEDDFRRGTTAHCSTFENEALCDEGYFDVMDLEVWGFSLDYF